MTYRTRIQSEGRYSVLFMLVNFSKLAARAVHISLVSFFICSIVRLTTDVRIASTLCVMLSNLNTTKYVAKATTVATIFSLDRLNRSILMLQIDCAEIKTAYTVPDGLHHLPCRMKAGERRCSRSSATLHFGLAESMPGFL